MTWLKEHDSRPNRRRLFASFLLQGLLVGFSIAAPVGPVGLLCIQRSLARGRLSGLVSGLGAATADATYGTIAALGLTSISSFLVSEQQWIRLIGGLFLVLLGVRIISRSKPASSAATGSSGIARDYASTFLITLSNPLTIISFAAIFAGLGLAGTGGGSAASVELIAGVFSGSCLWWVILSIGVGSFKGRLASGGISWVNRLSGAIIFTFGVVALVSVFVE